MQPQVALAREGVDNVVIDNRTHDVIATTHRAGILEAGSVRMLTETGVDGRINELGYEHSGIYLRFNGENHHIAKTALIGKIAPDGLIYTIWKSPTPIEPDPFLKSYPWAAGLSG